MDSKKAIRVLKVNTDSVARNLELVTTFYLQKEDRDLLSYAAFDNYTICGKSLQWKTYVFFLQYSPDPKPNETWVHEQV